MEYIQEQTCGHSRGRHCSSVAKSRPTVCDPAGCSTPGFPVLHYLPEFAQTHVPELMMPFNHLILCFPFLPLPSNYPRAFINELALRIRCAKY